MSASRARARLGVVVSTYEWPEALDAVIRALADQSDRDFALVVADDGSGAETAAVVERWRSAFEERLTHAWQPDEGFRLARVLNLGALDSRTEAPRDLAEPGLALEKAREVDSRHGLVGYVQRGGERLLDVYTRSHVHSSIGRTTPRHWPAKVPRAESPSPGSSTSKEIASYTAA